MPDSKFVIGGNEYEIPGFDTFDMDEAMLLYDNTGFGLEDLVYDEEADDAEQVAARFRHPGLIKTLLHVAYQRGNPAMNKKRVATMIGQSNYADAFVQLISAGLEEVEDQDPPSAAMSEPDASSPNGSSGSSDSQPSPLSRSGNGSSTSSDEPAADHPTTSMPVSAMSLVTQDRMPAA